MYFIRKKMNSSVETYYRKKFGEIPITIVVNKELPKSIELFLKNTFQRINVVMGIPTTISDKKVLFLSENNSCFEETFHNSVSSDYVITHCEALASFVNLNKRASIHILRSTLTVEQMLKSVKDEIFETCGSKDFVYVFPFLEEINFDYHPTEEIEFQFLRAVFEKNKKIKPRSLGYIRQKKNNFYCYRGEDETLKAGFELINYDDYLELGAVFSMEKVRGNGLGKIVLQHFLTNIPANEKFKIMVSDSNSLLASAQALGGKLLAVGTRMHQDIANKRSTPSLEKPIVIWCKRYQ